MRSRCRSASRRSRSLARSAHARQRSERSPCSAATSPTSAAATRVSPSFRQALQLAEEIGDHIGLERAYVNLTDALTMLGRPRESARLGQAGLEVMRRYGIDSTLLVANQIEALLAIGDWDEADRLSAAALRGITSSFPYALLIIRADLEIGRGDFDAARAHLEAARATLREDRGLGLYDAYLAELALWERRWTDADAAVARRVWLRRATREAAQIRVRLCAKGLRAQAELAALARARRDADAVRDRLGRAREAARRRSPRRRRGLGGHAERRRLARPGRGRVRARPRRRAARARGRTPRRPGSGSSARRSRPTAAGARPRRSSPPARPRTEASVPLREAHAVAARIGAKPLLRELELLAERARLDLDAAGRRAARREAGPGGDPRPDPARGGGPDARRPRLHQPRDRRGARHQRQDGQRPRLAHPAQARRAEPARGGRDRPPARPAAHRATFSAVDRAARDSLSASGERWPGRGMPVGRPSLRILRRDCQRQRAVMRDARSSSKAGVSGTDRRRACRP